MVGPDHLQSAIRLNSTGLQLGLLLGPAVGGLLMLRFGPAVGLLLNSLMYVPQIVWSQVVPYTGHMREAGQRRVRIGLEDLARVMREVSGNPAILAMLGLAGATSLFVGGAYQSQMPEFAHDLGENGEGVRYTVLQTAQAAGALVGGLALEGTGLLRPRVQTAIISGALFGLTVVAFAAAPNYWVAVALLCVAGLTRLAFGSMAQTLVQVLAPPHLRGRVLGVYAMASQGLQTGSGFTVGVLGALVGVHWSLGLSGLAIILTMLWLLHFVRTNDRRALAPAS
jgi:predicted MFS family arabinose efflux permease